MAAAKGASDAEAGGAAAPRASSPRPGRATSCSTRSSAPARPARWPSGSAGASSASSATRPMSRSRAERIAAGRASRSDAEAGHTRQVAREEPRVPFGWLVERGLLAPGTMLTSVNRRWTAQVRADGTLIAADFRGSIHQVGARRFRGCRPATAGRSGISTPAAAGCADRPAARAAPRGAELERYVLSRLQGGGAVRAQSGHHAHEAVILMLNLQEIGAVQRRLINRKAP